MANWIKLTFHAGSGFVVPDDPGASIWINRDQIQGLRVGSVSTTPITIVYLEDGYWFEVTETPDQITGKDRV